MKWALDVYRFNGLALDHVMTMDRFDVYAICLHANDLLIGGLREAGLLGEYFTICTRVL